MNLSKVISALQLSLGLYNITLPFKDEVTGKPKPTDQVIHEVLKLVTIPMFSQFVPWVKQGQIHIKDMQSTGVRGEYYLPAYFTITPVMYIIDIHLPYENLRGTYGDIAPAYGINRSIQGVATSKAYMLVAGQMRSEPTFEWMGDNKVKLYGWPKTMIEIECAVEHEPNGESIPQSCFDSFMELATLDMKVFLWNTLKHYNEIPTAFGTINLKLDEYQSAESDRNNLLDKWRDIYHVDLDIWNFM